MPRIAEFLEEVAQVIERVPSKALPEKTFVRHVGHTAFRDSPASTHNGFAVSEESSETTSGFGRADQKQTELIFVVELGHAPIEADDARARSVSEDSERIRDILEAKSDWRQGSGGAVDLVRFDPRGRTEKTNPLWWVTPLTFRALVWGPQWLE